MELLLRIIVPEYFYGIFFRNISRKNILKNVLKVVNFVHLLPSYDPKTNPPNIALFLGLNISRCQGCRGVIDRKVLQSPKDIAIRCKDF